MNTYVPIKNENLTYNPNIENINPVPQNGQINNIPQVQNNMGNIPMNNMSQMPMNHMGHIPMNNMQQMQMNNMTLPHKNNVVSTIETLENTKPGWFSNKGKYIQYYLLFFHILK